VLRSNTIFYDICWYFSCATLLPKPHQTNKLIYTAISFPRNTISVRYVAVPIRIPDHSAYRIIWNLLQQGYRCIAGAWFLTQNAPEIVFFAQYHTTSLLLHSLRGLVEAVFGYNSPNLNGSGWNPEYRVSCHSHKKFGENRPRGCT